MLAGTNSYLISRLVCCIQVVCRASLENILLVLCRVFCTHWMSKLLHLRA